MTFQQLGFPFPGQGKKAVSFLVWGGFASFAGATVIGTASKNNHELLKSLGAKYTFDYKDADITEQIKKVSNGG